ncbi:MAG: histidine phosphatase family protein [Deltaproteobacteria bacterium]|nr:histidine phosphatase family protein [Deltaproteobacteria bacterium]
MTRLVLIRHGDAEEGTRGLPDAHRGLTARGRDELRRSCVLLREVCAGDGAIDLIITSPLVRAVQTAEIVGHELGLERPIQAREIIVHPPTLEQLSSLVAECSVTLRGLALVGHEPTLSRYAAHLLGLEDFPHPFRKGMMLAMSFDVARHTAQFEWLILPSGPTHVREL